MKKAFLALILFTSCLSFQPKHYFNKILLKKVAQITSIEPPAPVVTFSPVYFIALNDSICESTFLNLQSIYQQLYFNKYSAFSAFLYDVLNQKIKINTDNLKSSLFYSQSFLPNKMVTKLYKEAGLKGIISKYCIYKNNEYVLSRNLPLNEINSVSYYFFINQFIRNNNDYDATFTFRTLKSTLY